MFLLTWLGAVLIWRYGHIEEKWSARLQLSAPEGDDPGGDISPSSDPIMR